MANSPRRHNGASPTAGAAISNVNDDIESGFEVERRRRWNNAQRIARVIAANRQNAAATQENK